MVEITGSESDRAAAKDVAAWCARELKRARENGYLETRPFVQNADLIIAALLEYAEADFTIHSFQEHVEMNGGINPRALGVKDGRSYHSARRRKDV